MLDATGQIFGRERAINLVRSLMERPERNGIPRSQDYPVLVVEGARGSGKTALLNRLATLLDQRVPYARIDFEASGHAVVPEVLSALAFELSRRCPRYGVLSFPRFTAGQLVMGAKLDLDNHPRACRQVVALLEKERNLDTARQILQETAGAALDAVQQQTGVPPVVAPVGKRLPGLVLDRLTDWALGRRLLLGSFDWYGHRGHGRPNDAVHELVDLNRWARNFDDEDNRQRIDQLLWDAFLADLNDAFSSGRRAEELSLNCVILLDNADTTLGQRFVNRLVQARRLHAAGENEAPDPMSVVVTSRGALLADVPAADRVELAAATDDARGSARSDDRHRHWWGRYRLEDLTRDQIGNMVSALALREGNNQRLTAMTLELTGGHPASTRLLLDAVAERPANRDDLAAVLDQPEPGTPPDRLTVADRMLQRLLVDFPQDAFHDLVTCAASRQRQHGLRLATSPLLAYTQAGYLAIIDPALWPTVEGAGPVLLRRLLLRELARRESGGLLGWSEVFDWHRAGCAEAGDLAGELYYALANQDLAFVTQRLHERLTHDEVTSWLELLASVISAPRRRPDQDDSLAPMDEMHALMHQTTPHPPLESLTRLIASLWIATDPFSHSRRRSLHFQIAADYTDIARLSHHGTEQLLQVAHHHRGRAEEWN
ncbi:MAG: hypothetical protein ACRDTE_24315 [Pseudonocardiaceae bacterium]